MEAHQDDIFSNIFMQILFRIMHKDTFYCGITASNIVLYDVVFLLRACSAAGLLHWRVNREMTDGKWKRM